MQNTEQTQQYTRHRLVKKYVEGETKEQRKHRKALDKLAKINQETSSVEVSHRGDPLIKDKYYVLCLKHGTKYSADYVNKLYNMVKRNCKLEFEMVCLTDDSKGIDRDIKIIPLPEGLTGWWCKPYMFSKDLPLKGTVLYLDLDVVIAKNIDKLFTYQPHNWCTIRDFSRAMRPNWPKYNSSVVRFKVGQISHVWEDYIKDPKYVQRRFFGDQDWLFEASKKKQPTLYPDEWIQSWKWEIRKSKDLAPGGVKGNRKLKTIENVQPPRDCCICVFHGDPNPHNCDDPWVVSNWR